MTSSKDTEGFAQPWLAFESQIGTRPLLYGPITTIDAQYAAIGNILVSKLQFPAPDASVTTTDELISATLKVRIYKPSSDTSGEVEKKKKKPVCVFYHGGGWAMGDLDGEDAQLRKASRDAGVVIVSVEYRLAPANPYPSALDDCVEAYDWAVQHSAELGTAPGEAIVFGTSAGANLALVAALRLIDEGRAEELKGVLAVVPVTVAPEAVPEGLRGKYTSYEEHAEHTINTGSGMEAFFSAYGADPKDPYVSPLLHKRIKDLPKTYVAVCGQDTLRDDGRLLKAALDEAGVPNLYDEYAGYPHWFWAFPSEHLAEPIAQYDQNLKKAFEFLLS